MRLTYYAPDGRLIYAGRGGWGISESELGRLLKKLKPLATDEIPLDVMPPKTSWFGQPVNIERVHWVRPELVCEVRYLAWTEDAQLREVTYMGLREDKPASEVRRAIPTKHGDIDEARRASPPRRAHGVPNENIMRVLPDAVVPSRAELERYWKAVGTRALKYLAGRPLTLVRHVNGLTFFHKGPLPPIPDSVHRLTIEKREGGEGVRVWIDDLKGLLGLLEMQAVELHPWGSTHDDIEHPDLLVFDLDPGAGIEWEFVLDTALDMREALAADGYDPWVKTSGGKGLHVMVPSAERQWDWDQTKPGCGPTVLPRTSPDATRATPSHRR